MSRDKIPSPPNKLEPFCVASGAYGEVWLFDEAKIEYDALLERNDETSQREAATLARYFERYADSGPRGFSEQMFKPQGRQKDGAGNNILIHEFKAYQFRIYGVVCTYKGKRAVFLGTSCDESKKKDKANPQKLKKAAEIWARIDK